MVYLQGFRHYKVIFNNAIDPVKRNAVQRASHQTFNNYTLAEVDALPLRVAYIMTRS